MIMKFKPYDFEECLMGLPLEDWEFVDASEFDVSHEGFRTFFKPKMLISHLKELNGISSRDEVVLIKGYTPFDTIEQSPLVPEYFKNVIRHARSLSVTSHRTLGSYLNSTNFDRLLYPLLVATNSSFIVKSYMAERTVNFKRFTNSGHLQFANYNEIIYQLVLKNYQYCNYDYNIVEVPGLESDGHFSYFIGMDIQAGIIEHFDFAVMLPNKRIMRFEETKNLLEGQSVVIDTQIRNRIYRICTDTLSVLRLQLKYKKHSQQIFDAVVWQPIMNLIERCS